MLSHSLAPALVLIRTRLRLHSFAPVCRCPRSRSFVHACVCAHSSAFALVRSAWIRLHPRPPRLSSFVFVRACPRLLVLVSTRSRSLLLVLARPRSFSLSPLSPLVPLVRARLRLCLFVSACVCTRLYVPALMHVRTRRIRTRLYTPAFAHVRMCLHLSFVHSCACLFALSPERTLICSCSYRPARACNYHL